MKKIILIISLLVSTFANSQIKAIVINSETKEKIPFVNIWIENENIGTTSNEKGEFTLNANNTQKIIFSAIGYENLTLKTTSIKNTVKLKPKITELSEIIVTSKKITKENVVGKFKKSKINFYFACNTNPWIFARYFKYKLDYEETPFLKTIRVLTNSNVKNAKFNIRLYNINEKGEPEGYIYNKNIIGIAKKGKKITEVNLSDLNIEFPKQGFFVAIEWLIIETNKHKYKYTMKGSKKKLKGISYEPSIGTVPTGTDENSWVFNRGKWKKVWRNKGQIKRYKNKYNLIAIELTLIN